MRSQSAIVIFSYHPTKTRRNSSKQPNGGSHVAKGAMVVCSHRKHIEYQRLPAASQSNEQVSAFTSSLEMIEYAAW